MKTIIFISLLTTCFYSAQKLTSNNINQDNSIIIYGETSKDLEIGILKFYNCILKNYPKEFHKNNYAEITPNEIFYKEIDSTRSITSYSLNWMAYAGNYNDRIRIQKKYSKCIKKSDINY